MATLASAIHEVMTIDIEVDPQARIAIIDTDWNAEICENLKHAAIRQLVHHGIPEDSIVQHRVPGSFELPFGVKQTLMEDGRIDAIIAIGCIVKGDTRHDEFLAQSVTDALMRISLAGNTPVILGVLTCDNQEQAIARSGGSHGNKGFEWALSALKMIEFKNSKPKRKIGF